MRKTNKLCPLFIAWLDAGAHVLLAPGYGCRPTAVWSSDLRTWVRTWTEPRFEVQVLISGRPGPLKRCRSRHMLNWTWGPNMTDLSTGEGLDENCLRLFESFCELLVCLWKVILVCRGVQGVAQGHKHHLMCKFHQPITELHSAHMKVELKNQSAVIRYQMNSLMYAKTNMEIK